MSMSVNKTYKYMLLMHKKWTYQRRGNNVEIVTRCQDTRTRWKSHMLPWNYLTAACITNTIQHVKTSNTWWPVTL